MRRTTKYISLVILIIMLIKIGVFAQPITGQTSYALGENVSLQGSHDTYEWFFYVEEPWKIKDAQIVMEYIPTQLTKHTNSSLTLSIDDTPFYSEKLVQPLKSGYLKVPIPKENIKVGYNKITLKSYIDTVNTGNWLNILKESKIWLSYEEKETVKLKHFPYPFIQSTLNKATDIIIQKEYTDGELEVALWLSSALGSYKPDSNLTYIKVSSTVDNKTSKNIIWVGNQKAVQKEYPKLSLSDKETSLIFLDRTKEQNRLIVCGDTKEALQRAAKLLMNKELIRQIDASYYIVKKDTPIDTLDNESIKDTISLKALGYGSIYMEGQQRNQTSVFINLPNETVLQSGAKFVLKAKYARNIDFAKSLVTLYINDQSVASSRLSEEKADEDTIDLYIDPNINMGKGSKITLAFDLEMTEGRSSTGEEHTPWALIEENSYFYLPQGEAKGYSFNAFPYPFVTANHLQDIGVIIPDNLKDTDLKILGNLFEQIGSVMQSNKGSIKVIRQGAMNQLDSTRHLIIYGTPQNNAAISTVNQTAYLQLNDTGEYFISNKDINILPEYGEKLVVCEIRPSVVNKKLGMLTIIAPTQRVFDKASENAVVLPNDVGQVIVINEEAIGRAYYTQGQEMIAQSDSGQNIGEKYENEGGFYTIQESRLIIISLASVISIGVVLVVLLVYLKNKKI